MRRIHLILTGGGTRGIYQIGALRAIKEAGLFDDIVSISSCSIGAINAAFIAQYGIEDSYQLWQTFTQKQLFKGIDQHAPDYYLKIARKALFDDGLDINPFKTILDEYIDEDTISRFNRSLILDTYNITKKRMEYHSFRDIPRGQLVQYLMASSRLPFFKPVFINGDKFMDGVVGDSQPYYSDLENRHFDLIIKIRITFIPYFIPGLAIKNISSDKEIEITPSRNIGTAVSFNNPDFESKYKLGYQDTIRILKANKLL